jgi:hypothetical protein
MRVRRLRSPALTYDKSCRVGQLGGRPGGSLTPNCGYRDNDNGASRARKSIWDGFTNVISELGENIRAGSSMSSARCAAIIARRRCGCSTGRRPAGPNGARGRSGCTIRRRCSGSSRGFGLQANSPAANGSRQRCRSRCRISKGRAGPGLHESAGADRVRSAARWPRPRRSLPDQLCLSAVPRTRR